MIHVISISFQLAGAVILMLWCLKGSNEKQIISKYFPGSNIANRDNKNNCILKKEKIRSITRDIYINVLAFTNLIIGYLISYFNVDTLNPIHSVILTLLFTTIIIAAEYLLATLIAYLKYRQDLIINYSQLEKFGVDTTVTEKEVDEMLFDIFNK